MNVLKNATVTTRILITWKHFPDPTTYESYGSIIHKNSKGFTVSYDDANVGVQPMPPTNPEIIITSISVVGISLLQKPLTQHNQPPKHDAPTIFVDGGARPSSGGPAASALYLQCPAPNGTATVSEHGRFYPAATNNVAEAIALQAALCLAARLLETDYHHVNIVVDSEFVYKMTLGLNRIQNATLKELQTSISSRLSPIVGKVSLCHMLRDLGNPSDSICTKCILTQQHVGDQTLFQDTAPTPPRRAPTTAPTQVHKANIAPDINRLDDFINLRKFKARSRAPANAAPMFTQLAFHQLMLFHLSETTEERELNLLKFLSLPSAYLPANASTNRIIRHLAAATPFEWQSSGRRERDPAQRISENVQRLVMDRKLRSANKLLQNIADHDNLSHEEKKIKLEAKFIDAHFACTIPLANIPHITANEVNNAVGRMSKQSATAVDGWSAALLAQLLHHQPSSADALAEVLTYLLSQPLSERLRDCVLLGRLVAVPKGEADVRPIVVSSVLLNLAGNIAVQRDNRTPSEAQYAIGIKQGCQRIIHKLRAARESGSTIVKFDLKNAFGMLRRETVQAFAKTAEPTLQQFFRLAYGSKTTLCIYGPEGHDLISFSQGVKQGDATSAYFFCHAMDGVLRSISNRTGIPMHRIFAYMDDLTFAVDVSEVNELATIVVEEFGKVGMQVNLAKSSAYTDDTSVISIPRTPTNHEFKLLGVDFGVQPTNWLNGIWEKQRAYFDLLRGARLHPHIAFVLLRICAAPRITYHISVIDPNLTNELTSLFERRLLEEISTLIDPSGNTFIPADSFFNRFGIGAPMLNTLRFELFEATRLMAIENVKDVPQLALTNQAPPSTHGSHQQDAQWLFFNASLYSLSPAQFSTALAIRLNIEPPHLAITGKRCSCGNLLSFDHILACDLSTGLTHSTRHNKIRDSIIDISRRYAITCTPEPNVYSYADGRRHRPDILFHVGSQGVVTDVTIVACKKDPGNAAEEADKRKEHIHATATSTIGHTFIPCAFEAHGHLGNGFFRLLRKLSDFIVPVLRADFTKDLIHAVSSVMAANRADAVHSAVHRHRWT